jgi:hypothetical protein
MIFKLFMIDSIILFIMRNHPPEINGRDCTM